VPLTIYKITCEEATSFVIDATWGLAKMGPDGKFEWVNPAYCEILNAPAQLIIGTDWKEWTYEADIKQQEVLYAQVLSGEIAGHSYAKRYIQRGSTPKHPRVIWGLLSVVGKWEVKEFKGFLVQFQPYDLQRGKVDWSRLGYFAKKNWKTILVLLAVLLSWMGMNSDMLLELLQKAGEVEESARSISP
jgi:PAS domain-containing protein